MLHARRLFPLLAHRTGLLITAGRRDCGDGCVVLRLPPPGTVVIPEGAGRCQGGAGLRLCGGPAFAGHGGMASRLVTPMVPVWRAGGSWTGRSPAALAAPQASFPARRRWRGAGKAPGGDYAVMGAPSPVGPAGRPAGCRHPFGCAPAWLAGGHGAVRVRSGQGQSQPRAATSGVEGAGAGGGQYNEAATCPAGPAHARLPRADGAADVPVAQAVEDQGEQLAGGRGLGDVVGLGAAAGDDRVLDVPRPGPGRLVLDRLDQRPAQYPAALLGICPRMTLVSDSQCRGVSPAQRHSRPGVANRVISPTSATDHRAPAPGRCPAGPDRVVPRDAASRSAMPPRAR